MNTTKRAKLTTYQLSVAALMAAVMCILGPLSLPIGPVPLSLTSLVIYFSVYLLGTRLGTVSYLVYLLLGIVGLPVFSGHAGGLAKLAGPTGGYLVGFIPMAIISGIVIQRCKGKALLSILGMAAGTLVDYALGTIWFVFVMQSSPWYALTVCVFPFVVGDFAKIVAAAVLGAVLRKRLVQANLLKVD